MIKIRIPENNHRERGYIIHVLLKEFLGLEYSLVTVPDLNDYELFLESGNKLVVGDAFFSSYPEKLSYLDAKHLPTGTKLLKNEFTPELDIPVIFGNSELKIEDRDGSRTLFCGIDLFASSFFMLTRWEEYVSENKDELSRFKASESFAHRNNFLHRPVVNEYLELLFSMLVSLGLEERRSLRSFTPYITHDVDFVLRWYDLRRSARALLGGLLKKKSMAVFFSDLRDFLATKLGSRKDPFDTFSYLMDLSEEQGFKSHFFFMSVEPERQKINYSLAHPFVQELIGEIEKRKHHIGIHPDFNSYNDPQKWKSELDRLNEFLNSPVAFGRQHYLQFAAPGTWQIWNDMGMQWDSSICYDDQPGFRAGTCYAYPVFNFLSREMLPLVERPLTIMDKSLVLNQEGAGLEEMKERAVDLVDRVRKYNGEFIFLWHNNCFNVREWKPYESIYPFLIGYLGAQAE